MMKKLVLFIVFLPAMLPAQDISSPNYIYERLNPEYGVHPHTKEQSPQKKSKNVFTRLILFYQKYLSVRDMKVCNFQLSCSNFGKQAIINYGAFWGILMINDRLLRDNSFAVNYYSIDQQSRLLIDEPLKYHYLPYYFSHN